MTSLLLIRAVMGVAEGAVAPPASPCVAEASKPRRRGFNHGLPMRLRPVRARLRTDPRHPAAGLRHVWRGVFLLVGIPGLILAGLLWMVIREPVTAQGHSDSGERAPLSAVFKHRNVPLGMLALLCAMCGIFVLSAR